MLWESTSFEKFRFGGVFIFDLNPQRFTHCQYHFTAVFCNLVSSFQPDS